MLRIYYRNPNAITNVMPTATLLRSAPKQARQACSAAGRSLPIVALAATLAAGASSCGAGLDQDRTGEKSSSAGGDARRGHELIDRAGCGSCHVIPGIRSAQGRAGPPLDGIAKRSYVGGALPNTPSNMVAWVQHPRRLDPATAMPDLGLTDTEARDVATYLYTLK